MTRLNGTNFGISDYNMNIYTKRTCSDNSELFISSKLDMLYRQAISTKNLHASRRNLRKMIEDKKNYDIL